MALRDEDEFLHQPPEGAPPKWQENLFFICWDVATGTGLVAHIQRVPGADFQEAQVVVAVDGRLASTSMAGPYRAGVLLPELVATPTEPFRAWRFQCEGKGWTGSGPLGFFAARAGGDTPISVDLTLASTLPVADFAEGLAAVVRGMRADTGGPQMGDQQHYEQGGTWRGRLRVGDHEVDATGLFVRDHSWGVRNEHRGFEAFWTASCLDDGRLFCNAIGIPRGDRVIGVGAVVDGSGATFTTEVGAAFLPAAGLGRYDRAAVTFGAPLSRTLTATTQLHVPIYPEVRSEPVRQQRHLDRGPGERPRVRGQWNGRRCCPMTMSAASLRRSGRHEAGRRAARSARRGRCPPGSGGRRRPEGVEDLAERRVVTQGRAPVEIADRPLRIEDGDAGRLEDVTGETALSGTAE